ncbi:MAG: CgeB family protein [Desulfovibrio sp.]|uniref:CgeB family protein n=1 Tax=Desulfovibrio sp. 7SRBS1 TaxID=3378064 RepID=UPI003B3C59FE
MSRSASRPSKKPRTTPRAGDSPKRSSLYQATPQYKSDQGDDAQLQDIVLTFPDGKTRHLCGRSGPLTEQRPIRAFLADALATDCLPVLLGTGLGYGLELLLEKTEPALPVAVIDREAVISQISGTAERYRNHPRVTWIASDSPKDALKALTKWQMEHGNRPLVPLHHPVYLRLDADFYGTLRRSLEASRSFDFWGKARYAKFKSWPPRILLLTSQYFLMGELKAACERMQVPHQLLDIGAKELGREEFVEDLLQAVLNFRPDFVLTVNHLGVDREGILSDLLEKLGLPLASWFVDNPHLILSMYSKLVNPWTTLFTWDVDNIPTLRALGFEHVFHLPLAADVQRFRPQPNAQVPKEWKTPVSFVGNSMVIKTRRRLEAADPSPDLTKAYPSLAHEFGKSRHRNAADFLHQRHPELVDGYESLATPERKLAFDTLITWESTRQYRTSCVRAMLPFTPLIVGDPGWKETFADEGTAWRWHKELSYYTDLPLFYPCSRINFNCTSLQMKGAVNQRVFDVPTCGAFLLTDHRDQIEELFEPGREVAVYKSPAEATDMARHYLEHPEERQAVTQAARKRVLAQHTYEHRMEKLMRAMFNIYK